MIESCFEAMSDLRSNDVLELFRGDIAVFAVDNGIQFLKWLPFYFLD
jgi:hypothetical protein